MNFGFPLPAWFFNNSVTLTYYSNESQDAEGGMTRTVLSTTTGVACSIQEDATERVIDQGREQEVISHNIYFQSDPALRVGDTVTFGSRIFSVVSTDSAVANTDAEWRARVRERR